MIYVFSSASRELYRQDALDALCYPEGHVMRFRYSSRLVEKSIRSSPTLLLDKEVMVVLAASFIKPIEQNAMSSCKAAEGSSMPLGISHIISGAPEQNEVSVCAVVDDPNSTPDDFVFLPLRYGRIADASFSADVLFVDVELGAFCDYGPSSDSRNEQIWEAAIKRHPDRPRPPGGLTEGFFIYSADPIEVDGPTDDQQAWKSLVERINRTNLDDCVTYRVLGLYRLGRKRDAIVSILGWLFFAVMKNFIHEGEWGKKAAEKFAAFRRKREARIHPVVAGPDCHYKFKMGETVALKMFFYRATAPVEKKTLRLRYDAKAFTSASRDEFHIGSRYDEVRVLLSCARTPDPTYAVVSVVQSAPDVEPTPAVWAPQPTFIAVISPPIAFLVFTLLLFSGGLFLLQLTAQDVEAVVKAFTPWLAIQPWFAAVAKFPKAVGTLAVFWATWRYVRKFPLK